MIESLKKLLNELSENTYKIEKKNLFALAFWIFVGVILMLLMNFIFSYFGDFAQANRNRPIGERQANFPKADYSSDRSWLECRDHQLLCLYSGLWDELSAEQIFDLCGHVDVCDEQFSGSKK